MERGIFVLALGLSCSKVCETFVPPPQIKPESPALEGRLLTIGPPGKFQNSLSGLSFIGSGNQVALSYRQ